MRTYPIIESEDGKYFAKVITDGGDGSLFYPNHGAIVAKWQDTDIDIAFIDMALYALYGWNGEKWLHCWKCIDRFTADPDGKEYDVTPVYDWEAWNEEAGEFQDSNGNAIDGVIGYEVTA